MLVVAFLAVVAGVLLIAGARRTPHRSALRRDGRADPAADSAPASCGRARPASCGAATSSRRSGPTSPPRSATSRSRSASCVGALALASRRANRSRWARAPTAALLGAGVLFGLGNLALLGLVARVGTGTGFTIAQLSLAVNAGIGIWVFHVPRPGTRQARKVLIGIAVAGIGSGAIAALR